MAPIVTEGFEGVILISYKGKFTGAVIVKDTEDNTTDKFFALTIEAVCVPGVEFNLKSVKEVERVVSVAPSPVDIWS